MSSVGERESAFSTAEVVGISVAAAAALGGVIIALGRTQANSSAAPPVKSGIDLDIHAGKVKDIAHDALEAVVHHYDSAAGTARSRGSDALTYAGSGVDVAVAKGKTFGDILRESVVPALIASIGTARSTMSERAKSVDTDELLEKTRSLADEAVTHLHDTADTVSSTLHDDVLPVVTPIMRDASGRASEFVGHVRERAEDAFHQDEEPQIVRVIESGKDSAQKALKTTSSAAKDSLSALFWLSIASALVYLVLLSPERRDKIKGAAFEAIEQIRLLIGDFQGYETEF